MMRALRAAPVVLLLLLQAAPAGAHAKYESSNPGDGATVSSPPSQVEANFSEPVTNDSYLEVTDPCGEVVSGASRPIADSISVSMSGSRAGTYTVYFRVQSTVDSHVTDGVFTFTSSGGDPCPGSEPPEEEKKREGGEVGGGGSDDPGPGPGGDTPGDPTTQTSDDPTTSSDPSNQGGSGAGHKGDKGGHDAKHGKGGGDGQPDVALNISDDEPKRREPDPWDLPMDALLIALALAAVIGAAGGRIYAGMLGPRT